MASRHKKRYNTIKHGGYSALGLLPGESPEEFERMHSGLIEELAPRGPLEKDVVSTLARLLWRKQNRSIFRTVELAKRRRGEIIQEELTSRGVPDPTRLLEMFPLSEEDKGAHEEALRVGKEQAQKELGDLYELTELDIATDDRLLADLAVEERLDAVIDKCIKRLLMVRGCKSLAIQMPSESPQQSKPRRIAGSAA
jgi:hypothetical protein